MWRSDLHTNREEEEEEEEEWNDEPLRDGSRRELSAIHQRLGDILAACFASCPPPQLLMSSKDRMHEMYQASSVTQQMEGIRTGSFLGWWDIFNIYITCMNWYMSNSCPPGHSHNHRQRFPRRRVRANCTGWCIRMVDLTSIFSRVDRHFWRLVPLYLDLLFPGCLTSTFLHLWIVEREIIQCVQMHMQVGVDNTNPKNHRLASRWTTWELPKSGSRASQLSPAASLPLRNKPFLQSCPVQMPHYSTSPAIMLNIFTSWLPVLASLLLSSVFLCW